VGFVVGKVTLGQVFSEYFGFSCQSSFHQLPHNHHHLSSEAGTIGQYWPQYQVDCLIPLIIITVSSLFIIGNKSLSIFFFVFVQNIGCQMNDESERIWKKVVVA
jgi:hypothetical protein